ncbi:recombination regulator RecX [Streptomyces sp. BH-SS-21]|uniref:Regulatory protein RecX n=1 Tax=Streptomyces liliiviolaceus TaxID=2823109 RepID=A0A940Y4Q4_9ACTN|nr:recombination regulator RecX [Streptomyces liliiviolaceus]MBQ0853011.1 recombination regulator RecX [Streptomyces liliiviolaceus]
MTRRTDWAEYVYPAAPEGQGQGRGGDFGSAGRGGEDEDGSGYEDGGPYGGDEPFGPGASGSGSGTGAGTNGGYGERGDHRSVDGRRGGRGRSRGDGSRESGGSSGVGSGPGAGEWPYGGGDGDGGDRDGARDEGAPGRGGRARRGRGRRSGFGESSGDAQDGGAPSSSRAEKAEQPKDPAEQARAICLRLLTGTARTRKQLADALSKREIPDDVADEVLSRFEEVGLINDSAFAEAWVESRHHGRGLARRALAQELRTKGVDPTLIDEAVAQLDSDQEEETARALVERKLRATRGLDRDKRIRRLAGMLARKGYSQGIALRVVRQALEEEGEDAEFLGDEEF